MFVHICTKDKDEFRAVIEELHAENMDYTTWDEMNPPGNPKLNNAMIITYHVTFRYSGKLL